MKVLLYIPNSYSLKKILTKGFSSQGYEVKCFDFYKYFPNWKLKLKGKLSALNFMFKNILNDYFIKAVNKKHLEIYKNESPADIVIIYNNELFLPDTLKEIKKRSKIVFYLGDNPLYSSTHDYNLAILEYADLIICPDTFWIRQLNLLGIQKTEFIIMGYNDEINNKILPTEEEKNKYSNDIIFIGESYRNAWGYRRSLFLNKFADMDIKIFANGPYWNQWFNIFPDLKPKVTFLKKRIDFKLLNTMLNCSKLYPVDANPGVLNGLHIRIFDCIGSEILPLVEFREDIKMVFKDVELPVIMNFNESNKLARSYLEDELKRINTIKNLKKYVDENYNYKVSIKKILNSI